MEEVRKQTDINILIGSNAINQTQGQLQSFVNELDLFEQEVVDLTCELAQVDASISDFRKSCDAVAQSVVNLGSSSADLLMKGDSSKTKGVIALAALAIKGFGYVSEKKKKEAALNEYNRQMDAVLSQKQQIANTKIKHVTQSYEKYSAGVKRQLEILYDKGFSEVSSIESSMIDKQSRVFKQSLCLVIKARFLAESMSFCLAEMTAWKKGYQNSNYNRPSLSQEFIDELSTWPSRLEEKSKSWNLMLHKYIHMESGPIPVPIATVISDPCMLRSFVGINIGEVDNCPNGIITMSKEDTLDMNPIVLKNQYYLHCKDIYENGLFPPKKKTFFFGIIDLILLLLLPAAFFGILVLLFHIEKSTPWRIFFIMPLLCWLGLGIEAIEQNFESFFPYVARIQRYNDSIKQFKHTIMDKENCSEFHIIN